jgi:hypothetical protein
MPLWIKTAEDIHSLCSAYDAQTCITLATQRQKWAVHELGPHSNTVKQEAKIASSPSRNRSECPANAALDMPAAGISISTTFGNARTAIASDAQFINNLESIIIGSVEWRLVLSDANAL